MKRPITVSLDGHVVGTLEVNAKGKCYFSYDEQYRNLPCPTPLSLSMPPQIATHSDGVIGPWIRDLLKSLGPLSLETSSNKVGDFTQELSGLLGNRDIKGSVEFGQESQASEPGDSSFDLETYRWLEALVNDGSRQYFGEDRLDQLLVLPKQYRLNSSVHEMVPRSVPMTIGRSTHVLKNLLDEYGEPNLNEHMCLLAARSFGLATVAQRAIKFGEEWYFIAQRFDRALMSNSVVKIHQETVKQAFGAGDHSTTQAFALICPKALSSLMVRSMGYRDATEDLHRYADRLIWDWVIANTSNSSSQLSFLLSGNQVRLAPNDSMSSSTMHVKRSKRMRFDMALGGQDKIFPTFSPWAKVAQDLGLEVEYIRERVISVTDRVADIFLDVSRSEDVRAIDLGFVSKMVDKIAERAEWCQKLMMVDY